MSERDRDMDRLIEEARVRRQKASDEYYSKPHPPMTEDEQRERNRARHRAAAFLGATVSQTFWDPVSKAWTCR